MKSLLKITGIFGLSQVNADLPLHCLIQDVAGEWEITFGKAQDPPFSDMAASIPSCGHHIPNNVLGALAIDDHKVVKSGFKQRITLSEDISGSGRSRHMKVQSDSVGGNWTMVFDEGMEMRMEDGKSLFAHFKYVLLPGAKASQSDRWTAIAQYIGRQPDGIKIKPDGDVYACHCDMTSTGWWHQKDADGNLESGCFTARKVKKGLPSLVAFGEKRKHGPVLLQGEVASTEMANVDKNLIILADNRDKAQVKPIRPVASMLRGSGESDDAESFPKTLDWRVKLGGYLPEDKDPLSEQFSQGACGSCYAFSGSQVLQMRFRIRMLEKYGIFYPLELSWKSATQCSPYTEGCHGGFAYLTFKQAAETGLPDAECDKDRSPESLDESCDWGCYRNGKSIFYAKNYGQTGGFANGADEKSIMRELQKGPVIVSFSTSAVPEFGKNQGHSSVKGTTVMTDVKNKKTPTEAMSKNPEVNPWKYTTHSILCVGWGEEEKDNGDTEKYWIVRNSWGTDWGYDGYAKFRRGHNDAAIETSAPWIEPDLDRLPEGFLEKARAYDAAQKSKRKHYKTRNWWKKKGKKGDNLYCKLRPNSPDCN
eukprot:TRINITY_DN5253_c0_g1_i1.p1 TRINITY_DN5253_c0_g1~~TRINITY_DN5253_c0_g1_i1.p1  ORF type:complete len:592 (-),score=135.85 TRINITY_DN5253_c0_g1_i1:102-1877(-)